MTKTPALLLALAVFVVPPAAVAGYSHLPQVAITPTATHGSLAGARRSPDSLQYIGCYVRDTYVTCTARNAAGATSSCYSYAPEYREAASAISPSTMITFQPNGSGVCTFLSVSALSTYLE